MPVLNMTNMLMIIMLFHHHLYTITCCLTQSVNHFLIKWTTFSFPISDTPYLLCTSLFIMRLDPCWTFIYALILIFVMYLLWTQLKMDTHYLNVFIIGLVKLPKFSSISQKLISYCLKFIFSTFSQMSTQAQVYYVSKLRTRRETSCSFDQNLLEYRPKPEHISCNTFFSYADDVPTSNVNGIVAGAYKRVDKKVKPVPGIFPEDARVTRQFPEDPLKSLPALPTCPPNFVPSARLTSERLEELHINDEGFLWPEEEKLFAYIFHINERTLAFEESHRGTFREDYFSPYIIPVIPHVPWEHKNIPIPNAVKEDVIKLLKEKIDAGVYEPSQASYRSRWFCVVKKTGKLRIVHDLQVLNSITIRDAGLPPVLDDFVEPYAGRQCYTVFDLFWGFDARKVAPSSRDLTSFWTPLGLLRITSMPMGFTNSPAEFQKMYGIHFAR